MYPKRVALHFHEQTMEALIMANDFVGDDLLAFRLHPLLSLVTQNLTFNPDLLYSLVDPKKKSLIFAYAV